LQTMRKSAGFEIADYIITHFEGDEYVQLVMKDFAGYIQQETLSHQIISGVSEGGAFTESFKLNGHELRLAVKKDCS
jgi:isoleucyl-tRNA synthetase